LNHTATLLKSCLQFRACGSLTVRLPGQLTRRLSQHHWQLEQSASESAADSQGILLVVTVTPAAARAAPASLSASLVTQSLSLRLGPGLALSFSSSSPAPVAGSIDSAAAAQDSKHTGSAWDLRINKPASEPDSKTQIIRLSDHKAHLYGARFCPVPSQWQPSIVTDSVTQ
jgi:hypothetical protein